MSNDLFVFYKPKLRFILVLGLLVGIMLTIATCSKKESIEYSLPPYPITEYHIEVDPDSLEYIYKNFVENHYINISLRIGNKVYNNAMMRIRGDSSRKLKKKSLKLKLPKGEKFDDGTRRINLNAEYADFTFMHQYLSSKTMNDNNLICFKAGYAPVYINNIYFGLYLRVENMDSDFLKSRNLSPKNNLYKATRDYSCMIDSNEVDSRWEKKTNTNDNNSADLKNLIHQLNSLSNEEFEAFAKTHFFYDEMINIIALNMLISNSSTYYHNYYMYHDNKKDKWRMFPWDLDKTFNPKHVDYNYQKTSWAEEESSAINTNTLIELFLVNENTLSTIRKRIVKLQDSFNSESYEPQIDSLAKQIWPYISADKTGIIKSKKRWLAGLDQMMEYIDERPQSLLTQIDNKPINFIVNRQVKVSNNSAHITWGRSIDPNGLPITYTIHYSNKSGFKGDIKGKIEGLENPAGVITNLAPGKYYFYIEASNGNYKTYGHDIRNFFIVP